MRMKKGIYKFEGGCMGQEGRAGFGMGYIFLRPTNKGKNQGSPG